MEEKLQELVAKYKIPEQLLKEAIQQEKEKVVLQKRRMVPILITMIERYADSPNS
ncbi:MAG: hypothetical protein HC849_24305 [Oscillatoriales cyanobacterium RU_3_3]|nr:hypothetical protein [Oscillatoriales cyanobacterium RU_3_3]NJR21329.1 hypothetical protein [Richelia sp. CSU_2_1]